MGSKAAIIAGLRKLCGEVIAGRYRIDELVAVGGMGAVFRSRHLQLDKDVALKLLRPDLSNNAEVCARLQREARLSSRLDHPNCVRVFDFGTTREGTQYLTMELLRGRDLSTLLRQPLLVPYVVEIVTQVLRGLDHAHRRGVLHRDIKPGNIRLVRDDEGRNLVKVCDFGIAKGVGSGTQDTTITQLGTIFGTPVYMSPEQAAGDAIDNRADIYAVGVVMFEMLVGRPPFDDPDPIQLLRKKMAGEIPAMPNVAPAVVAVVQRLMAVAPDRRYPDAMEACRALEAAAREATGQPGGGPPTPAPRNWYEQADAGLPAPQVVAATPEAHPERRDSSILRAFGAGLDKVLAEPTPHAGSRLSTGIHAEPTSPADDYIDMNNLQLEELGDPDD